jgi:hypothetical protein
MEDLICMMCKSEVLDVDEYMLHGRNHKVIETMCLPCYRSTEYIVHVALEDEYYTYKDELFGEMNRYDADDPTQIVCRVRGWKRTVHKRWTLARKTKVLSELEEIMNKHELQLKILKPELEDTHHYDEDELETMREQYKKHLHFFKKACLIMECI